MMLPYGLFSWLLAGLALGLVARLVLPGRPRLGRAAACLAGIWGAFLGGVLATALGFGGLVSFDARSVVTAALAAVVFLLLVRTVQVW